VPELVSIVDPSTGALVVEGDVDQLGAVATDLLAAARGWSARSRSPRLASRRQMIHKVQLCAFPLWHGLGSKVRADEACFKYRAARYTAPSLSTVTGVCTGTAPTER
jgi:hypothetical protein